VVRKGTDVALASFNPRNFKTISYDNWSPKKHFK
jgi:hypothetical protein